MAAMVTALTEFSDKENSRTYSTAGHTAALPRLVLQKRKVPSGSAVIAEDTITVLHGTADASSVPIEQRVSFSVTVRRPVTGAASDVTAALAIIRDIVAGDEFGVTVTGQNYLK